MTYQLPMYASLDFNRDRGYRLDCVPEDEAQERRENRGRAPAGWEFAETSHD